MKLTPLLALFILAGCVKPQNDRLVLDRDLRLEAFDVEGPPSEQTHLTPTALPAVRQPSVAGLVRDNWEPVLFRVPVDGTAHMPAYTSRWVIARDTGRQRRHYPTATSALQLSGGSLAQQQLEVPANVAIALFDIVALPFRAIWQPPWTVRWSPHIAYERYWHPERPEVPLPVDETPRPEGPFVPLTPVQIDR